MSTSILQSVGFQLHTLWLFTLSDHKPLVYPMTATGLFNLLAGSVLNSKAQPTSSIWTVLQRFPHVLFWVWFNFLVFCVGNQRLPGAIAEDAVNKPWRPLPSKRLTASQATALWISLHVIVVAHATQTNTTGFTLALMLLGWLYNDWEGGNHYVARNLINAWAVVFFALGATQVAYGDVDFAFNQKAVHWHVMIAAIVFTTLQVQDLCDQEGDKCRGRLTIPLLLGDGPTRWTVLTSTAFWSHYVPWFWDLPAYGHLLPLSVGATICWRLLTRRGVAADRTTYRLWGLWISCLLALPALKRLSV